MQRQRKTRYKDKKDKEYRETGKTMCAGIFLSTLADWFDQKRCDVYSALPGTHVVSVISNPGFLANCLSCTSRTINAGQRTFSFNLRLVSDWESEGGIALADVYHTDWQCLQCELTERSSFEWKQNPCQVEGQHDEACIAMLNNFYADGAVCLVFNVVFEDCIMNVMFINNIDVISFIIIVVFKISFLWAMTIYII